MGSNPVEALICSCSGLSLQLLKARFKPRTSHVLNLTQMSKIHCSSSFALHSAHDREVRRLKRALAASQLLHNFLEHFII